MATEGPYEELGEFRLYPPVPGTSRSGWTLSWRGEWLPGAYDTKDVCVLLCGMLLRDSGHEVLELMGRLQEGYNRGTPSVGIVLEDVLVGWLAPGHS